MAANSLRGEEEEEEGWTRLPCPGQRGDGQAGGRARAMGLRLHPGPVTPSSTMEMAGWESSAWGQSKYTTARPGTVPKLLKSHPQALCKTVY